MWQQNLGISVELENMDWKVYLSRQNAMDYQISRAGWIGDYEDPNTFLDIMRTGRGNNRTGWSNQEFDELVGKANATTDQEERYRLLGEAEKILIDESLKATNGIKLEAAKLLGWGRNTLARKAKNV